MEELETLKEKIVGNHLILDQVMGHLPKEDLLRLSLVNKLWCGKARQILNTRRKCEIILKRNPCRELLALNAMLENRDKIFYNGIKLVKRYPNDSKCRVNGCNAEVYNRDCSANCLSSEDNILTLDDVRHMYSNLLTTIRFEYIRMRSNCKKESCPFMLLIQILLQDKGIYIKELRIEELQSFFEECMKWSRMLEKNVYPNLKVIEAGTLSKALVDNSIPNISKMINKFQGKDCDRRLNYTGRKSYLFTRVAWQHWGNIFKNIEEPPKWERLSVDSCDLNKERFFEKFLWASTRICRTLKKLRCDLEVLSALVAIPTLPQFWGLKEIFKSSEKSNQPFNHIQKIDWATFAPNLSRIIFQEQIQAEKPVVQEITPEQVFQSSSVRTITYYHGGYFLPYLSTMFPNVTALRLTNIDTENIVKLLEDTSALSALEELNIHGRPSLNVLLDMSDEELEEIGELAVENSQQLCVVPRKASILNRRGLKRIIITFTLEPNKAIHASSHEVLSAGAAALMCSTMPRLCLVLNIFTQYVAIEDKVGYLEHIRPYASEISEVLHERRARYHITFGHQ